MNSTVLRLEDAARCLAEVVDGVHPSGESAVLVKNGRPVARIVAMPARVEGTAAAVAPSGSMYLLGNIIQDNNKRDVVLIKVDTDGNNESHRSFGALEGDDIAAAVSVLPDGRIAVVATIELETQKKIALFILSPDSTFVNN